MKLTIEASRLNQALGRVIAMVPPKPTLPILVNVRLTAADGVLRIMATNMDISIEASAPCSVEEPGGLLVNGKRLFQFCKEIQSGDITLTLAAGKKKKGGEESDSQLGIGYEGGSVRLAVMDPEDFPLVDLDPAEDDASIVISGHDLTRMVQMTNWAVAAERTRIVLTGALLEFSAGEIAMVATDGHVLAMSRRKAKVGVKSTLGIIIPPRVLQQVARLIADGEELGAIDAGLRRVLVHFGSTVLSSKLIEGPYPNYNQVIPKDHPFSATVAVAPFERAIRRALVASNPITHGVRLSIRPGEIDVSVTNMDTGTDFRETVAATFDGDPIDIGFNSGLLREILSKIEADETELQFSSATGPMLVKPPRSEECETLTFLIMPLRLND